MDELKETEAQLKAPLGVLEQQKLYERLADLEMTEKVYHMNREWIAEAKQKALEDQHCIDNLRAMNNAYRAALETIRDRLEEHANNAFETGLLTIAYNTLSQYDKQSHEGIEVEK